LSDIHPASPDTAASAGAEPGTAGQDNAEIPLGEPFPMPDLAKVWKAGFAPLVDPELGAETAMLKAEEVGGALLQHFLSIANDVPKTVKYLFSDAASPK
jgi:hypothetical protein